MTSDTPKELQEWKEAFAKMGIHYETDDEYKEAIHNLVGYFETLIEMDRQQKESKSQEKNASSL